MENVSDAGEIDRKVRQDLMIYLLCGEHPDPVINEQIALVAHRASLREGPIKQALDKIRLLEEKTRVDKVSVDTVEPKIALTLVPG